MKIQVIGCSGGMMPGEKTSCYLVNNDILVDAGSVASALSFDEQLKINHVLITHSHNDHVKDLGFLVDNMTGEKEGPIFVYSTEEIIGLLKNHFFNDIIWPDFSVIPSKEKPILKFKAIGEGDPVDIEGMTFTAVALNHTVPSVAYFIDYGSGTVIVCGDTTTTDELWTRASSISNLKGIIIEISFPNRLQKIADESRHYTPAKFEEDLKKLGRSDIPIFLTHFKPHYSAEVKAEISKINYPDFRILSNGDILEFN